MNSLLFTEAECTFIGAPENDLSINFSELLVSAGENITVSSPAGTFNSLATTSSIGPPVYSEQTNIFTLLPLGLTVDIPGEVFPAFANVAVPDVQPLTGVVVNSTGTEVIWDAGSNPSALISIIISDTGRSSICLTADDGQFSVPVSYTHLTLPTTPYV